MVGTIASIEPTLGPVIGVWITDTLNWHWLFYGMMRLIAGAAQRYGAIPGSPDAGHLAALKTLWRLAYREASTLAYADAFRAIMVAFIIATLLVPLLRKAAVPAPAAASH